MIDPEALAALLCDWCLEPQAGQQVLVATTTLAEPLVRALHRALLERGAWLVLDLAYPGQLEDFYRHAREEQFDSFAPIELERTRSVDASLRIEAPVNTRALAGVDPELLTRVQRAREPVQRARSQRRWCVTQWPTPALAQEASMSEAEYAGLLERALFLHRADPVAAWRELSAGQQALVERLGHGREVRLEAEGTDLRLRVDGRTWINSDGRRNMPSGEVFTGPLEESAQGTIRFTIPSTRRGALVEEVELEFAGGEVVDARAGRGERHLRAALATDPGARRLGELGIGTNHGITAPTGSVLLDEKIAGTVHLALGRSYPETGGVNQSALHWDLVCDLRGGGALTVDGEEIDLFAGR